MTKLHKLVYFSVKLYYYVCVAQSKPIPSGVNVSFKVQTSPYRQHTLILFQIPLYMNPKLLPFSIKGDPSAFTSQVNMSVVLFIIIIKLYFFLWYQFCLEQEK